MVQGPDAPIDAKLLSDNTVAYGSYFGGGFGSNPAGAYYIRRLDGTLVRKLQAVGTTTDFHDLQELPGGNYLIASYKPRDHVDLSPYSGPSDATVVDAEIQEVTPAGSLVWSWNSKDHIDLAESTDWWRTILLFPTPLPDGRTARDVVHFNSVEPDGGSVIISLRHTDGVFRIDRTDGHIQWKLGGTTTPESLTVLGDPQTHPLSGQHDARRLADGTVSVFDNGTGQNRPPRVVRYQIDPVAKTATLVESLSDPEVPTSSCCGSARKLGSGGWLVGWGGPHFFGEYASAAPRVLSLKFDDTVFSYRSFPVPQGRLSAASLRQGMDTMFPRVTLP